MDGSSTLPVSTKIQKPLKYFEWFLYFCGDEQAKGFACEGELKGGAVGKSISERTFYPPTSPLISKDLSVIL